jgi:hypothetical protein
VQTLAERFWHKVNKTETCWLWIGSQNAKGYGKIQLNRRSAAGHPVADYAHRIAWIMVHGPIPVGLDVLHKCDTPACVRDEHLFLGTPLDNVRDMIAKGRRVASRKLDAAAVSFIRSSTQTQVILAKRFGVSQSLICLVRKRAA